MTHLQYIKNSFTKSNGFINKRECTSKTAFAIGYESSSHYDFPPKDAKPLNSSSTKQFLILYFLKFREQLYVMFVTYKINFAFNCM